MSDTAVVGGRPEKSVGLAERVLLDEFEKAIVAEAAFFGEYAKRWS